MPQNGRDRDRAGRCHESRDLRRGRRVLASWAAPTQTGYVDTTGATDGVTSYTVTVSDTSGATVSTTSVTSPRAVLTGLTDGSAYTITVAATNPAATGPTVTSSSVTPVAVAGGPAQYISAAAQLLNAQDNLETGTVFSTADAISGDTEAAEITAELGVDATGYEAIDTDMASDDQQDTDDTTSLSNSLAVPSTTGQTVTVYTTANETFTTIDTSTGTSTSIPGSTTSDMAYLFLASATAPTMVGRADGDAITEPLTENSSDTATATNEPSGAPSSTPPDADDATDTTGSLATSAGSIEPAIQTTSATTEAAAVTHPSLGGIAAWANANLNRGYNGFGDDCTDFVSRALHFGGGLHEVGLPLFAGRNYNPDTWFDTTWTNLHTGGRYAAFSSTWSLVQQSADYQSYIGAHWLSWKSAQSGDIIYVDWTSSHFNELNHAAVIVRAVSTNLYMDQHSPTQSYVPLWKIGSLFTWQKADPGVHVWIADPYFDR